MNVHQATTDVKFGDLVGGGLAKHRPPSPVIQLSPGGALPAADRPVAPVPSQLPVSYSPVEAGSPFNGALEWARQGKPVFPCRNHPGSKKHKAPLTNHGFKDASTDADQIRAWWTEHPTALIGVPTGPSSGIDVLDLDVKGGKDGLAAVPEWETLSPAISRTGSGGAHLYFKSDGTIGSGVGDNGVDTRGVGGYVIVPPSAGYQWVNGHDLSNLPPFPEAYRPKNRLGETKPGVDPEADPALIAAALAVIPAPENWERWNRIAMAAYRATGGSAEGFEIFDAWSSKGANYGGTDERWEALHGSPPTSIGAGTIFKLASEAVPNWRQSDAAVAAVEARWHVSEASADVADDTGLPLAPAVSKEHAFDFDGASRIDVSSFSNIPDREFVLGSRFQPGTITLGIGPAGVSKSTFSILTGLSIATGRPLTDEIVFREGPVLLYNAEDPLDEMRRRVAAVARYHQIDLGLVAERVRLLSGYDGRRLVFAERTERNGTIKPGKDLEAFCRFVKKTGMVHVGLDPMVALHRGLEENSSGDMERLGDYIRIFAKQTGVSVDLVHHTVKSRPGAAGQQAGVADSARGSGAVIAFARSAYTLTPMSDKIGAELRLAPDQTAQLVRLDDAKRNNTRRSARERWFELKSVLPDGRTIAGFQFETSDPIAFKQALMSSAVHVAFDIRSKRALALLASTDDEKVKRGAFRALIAALMESETVERSELAVRLIDSQGISETTARTNIDEAVPEGRHAAVKVECGSTEYLLWRQKRRGKPVKWVLHREATGQIVRPESDEVEGGTDDLSAAEGAFE